MNPSDTRRVRVDWPTGESNRGEQEVETGDVWSFGSSRERMLPPVTPPRINQRSAAENTTGTPTGSPHTPDVPDVKPQALSRPYFGKRSFQAAYQWEGVVEALDEDGFRARLLPFENGHVDPSRVEYADFDYGDLADESDRELVAEGAIFYWTVGRSRNPAGTYTNTSLVRFRRLPPPTPYEMQEANREAAELLADLGADD